MLFNSYIFIFVFLPISFIIFFGFTRFHLAKIATIWLTFSSFLFYSFWNLFPPEGQRPTPEYLILIIFSIIFNYQMGILIGSSKSASRKAKLLLTTGILVNLGLIAYYKYAQFILSSVGGIIHENLRVNDIILPLGISFYTFNQIAYLFDVYREEKKNYSLTEYALFITFFPHLIAGPIVRHDELIPQFYNLRFFVFSHKNIAWGLTIFILGLGKKVLIADNLSPWIAPIFTHANEVSFIEAWTGALSYTFQLYFDFSGYSDMAIGLALLFNIRLPINFDSPYKAISITDFWRRWHITLSNFLRDYLYIPLGGSRRGEARRYANLIITMLLGGLWHGAGWTFIVWGGLHGIYLSINHGWRKLNISLPKFLAWTITFFAVIIGWVLFRSHTFADAKEIIKAMIGLKGIILPGEPQGKLSFLTLFGVQLKSWTDLIYLPNINDNKALSLITLAILTLCVNILPNTQEIVRKLQPNCWWAMGMGLLASCCLLSLNRVSEFLYFKF